MPVSNEDLSAEMLRTRDRLHRIETDVAALKLLREADAKELGQIGSQVTEMIETDKIAVAVAARVNASRRVTLSRIQKGGIALAALVPIVSLVLRLAGVEGI